MSTLTSRDEQVLWHPFTQLVDGLPLKGIVKGDGAYLITEDGRRILDGISSWWVNLHGHAHPEIAEAIATQAATMEHVLFAGFTHEPAVKLAEELLACIGSPYEKVFYSDNGSTSTEVAIKMAIQWWHNQGGGKRKKIIALDGGYHGDTFGAMAVGERGSFTTPFHSYLFDVEFIPVPTDDNIDKVLDQFHQLISSGEVAAFIFEPLVQGSAGMRMYQPHHLDQLLALAHEKEVITIADEVFTGFGRLGTSFACHQLTHKPDIVCLSKGLTGGFLPLGATLVTERIIHVFRRKEIDKSFLHGHSYTANPLSCMAGVKSLELLQRPACQENIQMIDSQHHLQLQKWQCHPRVQDVHRLGTILAVEWKTDSGYSYLNEIRHKLYPFFLERNVLLRPLGNVVYLVPPYCIKHEELEKLYELINEALETI